MPWKERYTISDERSIADADVVWPHGKRCCVRIVVDLSPPCGPEGITPKVLRTAEAHFGQHGGLSALRETLQRFGLRATFAVPGAIAELYPKTTRELWNEGHEIAAHGFKGEDVSSLDCNEEARRIARTSSILVAAGVPRPKGFFSLPRKGDKFAGGSISDSTMDLLIEQQFDYMGNSLADDIPHYWVTDFESRRSILALPYYYHFDDQFFLLFPEKGTGLENPGALLRNWKSELDAQHRRGRHFAMVLHPYAIGWPNRLELLEEFLAHMRGLEGLWNPTSGECAQYWLKAYPAATNLKLEPSVWRDYPGSLS